MRRCELVIVFQKSPTFDEQYDNISKEMTFVVKANGVEVL